MRLTNRSKFFNVVLYFNFLLPKIIFLDHGVEHTYTIGTVVHKICRLYQSTIKAKWICTLYRANETHYDDNVRMNVFIEWSTLYLASDKG